MRASRSSKLNHVRIAKDKYLIAALAITLLFFAYFAVFAMNALYTFNEQSDLGIAFSYNMFFNIHYPQIAYGLQFISVCNHVSPFMLLIMPFYLLYESSLTILIIQLVFTAITGLAIFFVARDLIKNELLSLILCIAFFIYPGTVGQVVFGAHIEFPITLFYLLAFYFYIKQNMKWFIVFSVLLVSVFEVAPILTITLGIGIAVYEYRRSIKTGARRIAIKKRPFIIAIIAISIIASIFYYLSFAALSEGYSTGAYPGLPHPIYVTNSADRNLLAPALIGLLANPVNALTAVYHVYVPGFLVNLAYALVLVVFGFGVTLLFIPDVSFVFILPWLAGVFILGYVGFVLPLTQYFGYVTGPVICATMLGIISLREGKGNGCITRLIKKLSNNDTARFIRYAAIAFPIVLSVAAPITYLFVITPFSAIHRTNAATITALLLFHPNESQQIAYNQLNWVIKQVPQNASLITDNFITPHVTNREYLDIPEAVNSTLPFVPDFILIDTSSIISTNRCRIENCTELQSLLGQDKYFVYAQNGSAILYKRNG